MKKHIVFNRLIMILYSCLIVAMAWGTIVQQHHGPAVAIDSIYGSGWFIALWIGLFVIGGVMAFKKKIWQTPPLLFIFISLMLMLIGALITKTTSTRYQLQLFNGESYHELPFDVRLDECSVLKYQGTEAAMNYSSILTISESNGDSHQMEISVNHIGRYRHYRFYQMGYEPSGGAAILVSHDPWGMGVTYSGYAMLLVALAWLMLQRKGPYRQVLSKIGVAALILLPAVSQAGTPQTLSRQQAQALCEIYVNYHDRICPLQTLAYDVTNQLYGKKRVNGLTAEQVLSGWMLYPNEWIDFPTKGGKHLADQKALQQALMEGQLFRVFPIQDSVGCATWVSPVDKLPREMEEDAYLFVRHFLSYCQELAFHNDPERLDTMIAKLARYQMLQAQDQLPRPIRVKAERGWNKLSCIKPISMGVATIGVLMFLLFIICLGRGKTMKRWVSKVCSGIALLMGAYLLLLELLRWVAQGYIPMTNGYEIMLFLATTLLLTGWLLRNKLPILVPAAIMMAGLTLLVAMMSGGNMVMTQMVPVLQSPLLCIHVSVIMLSYMLLSFVLIIAIAALLGNQFNQERMRNVSLVLLYPAAFLLAAGIIVGSIWANISWGTYWGWDPKEVWALISLMIYAVPLYAQHSPWFSRPRNHQTYCLLAFLSVVITYFGVNLILGGMHSYA